MIKKTLEPQWDETLTFDRKSLRGLLQAALILEVFDKVLTSQHVPLRAVT